MDSLPRLAFDIGGAHLKLADGNGLARAEYFPLWQRPSELSTALQAMLAEIPSAEQFVATMTGELADCFATKAEGVRTIVAALTTAAEGRPLHLYRTDGRWADAAEAVAEPLQVAASNWHALARFGATLIGDGCGLLIDIGSTTVDLIPVLDGVPNATGSTDLERLAAGELVYTGVVRSPICGVTTTLPWRGHNCPTPQEVFATTWDAYLLLGELPEEPDATHTADGRPATRRCAHDRLARSLCADRTMFDEQDARSAAQQIRQSQQATVLTALAQVLERMQAPPHTVVISGQGEFLARSVVAATQLPAKLVSLNEILGPHTSRCATAHALARVTAEHPPE